MWERARSRGISAGRGVGLWRWAVVVRTVEEGRLVF